MKIKLIGAGLVLLAIWAFAIRDSGLPKISEAEVVASLTSNFSEFYKTSAPRPFVPVSKVDVKVTNVQIGNKIEKQLQYGKMAEEIWPVRAEVEITIHYAQAGVEPSTVIRGAKSIIGREGFAFHKNGFGEWAADYMSY